MGSAAKNCLNFNIGVLGHVDSGKTSLAKVLSTTASTASFDKNPQSQERGITIDLGFSSFTCETPSHFESNDFTNVQYTLVDCPGHASLIRAIIGGAQIIDAMLLIVDITKGIQTQTAECIVIGEILCNNMLIVLNKLDMVPEEKRKATIEKMSKRLRAALQNTKFVDSKIVAVAANPGGNTDLTKSTPIGIDELIESIRNFTYIPQRQKNGPLVLAVDHCFSIKGQGTVLTGTVLEGAVCVNDNIEMPTLKMSKKVKSIQMFKKPVDKASQGDRVGVCVTQFDPKLLERGIVGSPSLIQISFGILAKVEKIDYYKLSIETKAKFHISMGHETVMAKVTFFGTESKDSSQTFDFDKEYVYQSELLGKKNNKFEDDSYQPCHQYVVLEFEKPIPVLPNSMLIGSRLDMDVHTSMCRLAFKGQALEIFTDKNFRESSLPKVKVYKNKSKEGLVERMVNDNEVIVKNLLKKDSNLQVFIGLKVDLSTGESGVIDSSFGQSGKIKVNIRSGLNDDTKTKLSALGNKKKSKKEAKDTQAINSLCEQIKVNLAFKKYVFSHDKKMIQS